jgi:16S rRNA processing protein RimM
VGSRESRETTPRVEFRGDEVAASRLSDLVAIGVVVTSHGVRGTLRVRAFGSGKHLRKNFEPVIGGARYRVSSVRQTPKGFLVDVEGIGSRADADSLRGEELLLDREELDATVEGEFYVADLVGLTAVDDAGEVLGTVDDTFETGAHEVLVVRGKNEGRELYIPFTLEHVPELDLESRRVVIRPPED